MDRDMAYSLKRKMTIFEIQTWGMLYVSHPTPTPKRVSCRRLNYQPLFHQRLDVGNDRNQAYILSMIGR